MSDKVLLIGPLPPPSGGISIHIDRLAKLLKNDFIIGFIDEAKSFKSNVFNIRSLNLIKYFIKIKNSDLIFIQSGSHILRLFHLIVAFVFAKKIILTVHAYPVKKNYLSRKIDESIYRFATRIIVVNNEILERINLPPEKYLVKNAFIPPLMESEPDLPRNVKTWLTEKKESGRLIVCANAWQLDVFENQDLYGLDLCIQVTYNLNKQGYSVSLIFNVSSLEKNYNLYVEYHKRIKVLNLSENFLLINEKLSFVKIIEQADIVLRPTNTDGDALTVREAIYLGKPIIASDILSRPPGTILFKSRNIDDLELKIIELINNKRLLQPIAVDDNLDNYRIYYKELITKAII